MNTVIEILNGLGERLLDTDWPILWQSSLLIVAVFGLDYLFAKKVRAAVRYALWLVVLLKLLLPPTLALPTGVAWWLTPAKPVTPPPVVRHYTVTYGDALPPLDFETQSVPLPPPPPPRLKLVGWLFLTTSIVSLVLLLWMTFRWWQVMRIVRQAKPSEKLSEMLVSA